MKRIAFGTVAGLALLGAFSLALSGCSALAADVNSQDLSSFTADLAEISSDLAAIPADKLTPSEQALLAKIRSGASKSVKVADLLTRVAKGAGH